MSKTSETKQSKSPVVLHSFEDLQEVFFNILKIRKIAKELKKHMSLLSFITEGKNENQAKIIFIILLRLPIL